MKNICPGYETRSGKNHPRWNGGKAKHNEGYVFILCPEHPNAYKGRYVLEHRLKMEKKLGRYLTRKEHVHHRNGIKNDNRLCNLELISHEDHTGLTFRGGKFKKIGGKRKYFPPSL